MLCFGFETLPSIIFHAFSWSVFHIEALFFQDPADAIPKGTLAAIATTFCTYIIYPIMIGAAVLRDATGALLFPCCLDHLLRSWSYFNALNFSHDAHYYD